MGEARQRRRRGAVAAAAAAEGARAGRERVGALGAEEEAVERIADRLDRLQQRLRLVVFHRFAAVVVAELLARQGGDLLARHRDEGGVGARDADGDGELAAEAEEDDAVQF